MREYAAIRIDPRLHQRIKIRAAMQSSTIKDWVEAALEDALNGKRLIDTRSEYTTKGEENA